MKSIARMSSRESNDFRIFSVISAEAMTNRTFRALESGLSASPFRSAFRHRFLPVRASETRMRNRVDDH